MVKGIKEPTNVSVEHPAHLLRNQSHRQCIQRLMRTAPWPEPVRESEKVLLIDGSYRLGDGSLHDLILQNWDSNRPLTAVALRDVSPLNKSRPVRPPLQSLREVLEVVLQFLPIVTPCLSVYPRCRFPFEPKVAFPQPFHCIDMVKERREPLLPILPCCFPYPLKRTGHASPALGPERGLLKQVPLGQPPSLHLLRGLRLVRRLPRYY